MYEFMTYAPYICERRGHGGMSLPMIGALLGHSQPRTTDRYAHLAADPLRKAAEQIGKKIFRTSNLVGCHKCSRPLHKTFQVFNAVSHRTAHFDKGWPAAVTSPFIEG